MSNATLVNQSEKIKLLKSRKVPFKKADASRWSRNMPMSPNSVTKLVKDIKNIFKLNYQLNDIENVLRMGSVKDLENLLANNLAAKRLDIPMCTTCWQEEGSTLSDSLKDGNKFVNMKHCYADQSSPNDWLKVAKADKYGQYQICLKMLKELTVSEGWMTHIGTWQGVRDGNVDSCQLNILGTGAACKDLVLLTALARQFKKIQCTLIDFSSYMLQDTLLRIQSGWSFLTTQQTSGGQRMPISGLEFLTTLSRPNKDVYITHRPLVCDFGKLHKHQPDYFSTGTEMSPAVWAILGGTFGNLPNETSLMEGLKQLMKKNDLFIVAVDTVPDGVEAEKMHSNIAAKYGNGTPDDNGVYPVSAEIANLLAPSVRKVYDKLGYESENDAKAALKLVFVDAEYSRISSVITPKIFLPAKVPNESPLDLVVSTRYDANEMIKFVEGFGFALIDSIGDDVQTYRQFLFKRC